MRSSPAADSLVSQSILSRHYNYLCHGHIYHHQGKKHNVERHRGSSYSAPCGPRLWLSDLERESSEENHYISKTNHFMIMKYKIQSDPKSEAT